MDSITLLINDEIFDLKLSASLKTANYKSELKVEEGGFSSGNVRGSGYQKAAQSFSFAFWVWSYENDLLSRINEFVSKIVYLPGATYSLKMILNEKSYTLRLSAPEVSKDTIDNLKTLKITLSFQAIDNYFIADEESAISISLVDNEPTVVAFNSSMPVPFSFTCNVKIANGGQALYFKFGDFSSRFIQINQIIPAKYSGVCRLSISSEKCLLEDLDLSSSTLGTLPIVSKSARLSVVSNVLLDQAEIRYRSGAIL